MKTGRHGLLKYISKPSPREKLVVDSLDDLSQYITGIRFCNSIAFIKCFENRRNNEMPVLLYFIAL